MTELEALKLLQDHAIEDLVSMQKLAQNAGHEDLLAKCEALDAATDLVDALIQRVEQCLEDPSEAIADAEQVLNQNGVWVTAMVTRSWLEPLIDLSAKRQLTEEEFDRLTVDISTEAGGGASEQAMLFVETWLTAHIKAGL